MKKPLLLGGAAVVFGAVLFFLLSGDGPGHADLPVDDVAVEEAVVAPEGPLVDTSARESAVAEGLTVAEAPDEVVADGPPESYTKALGGLIGRVVERDGTPMPALRIELLAATLEDFLPDVGSMFGDVPPEFDAVKDQTDTDDEGRFRFTGMDPRGVYVLGIDLGGARATIRFVDRLPNAGEIVDLGDVVLDPYVTFTGRVVDERRQPIANARIRATNLPSILFTFGLQEIKPDFHVAFQEDLGAKWRVAPIPRFIPKLIERFPIPSTLSLQDGTFRLEGVPLGLATVLVDRKGLVSLVHGPVPTGEAGEKDLGNLVLRAGEELIGRVVDPSDEPMANVTIIAGARLELAPAAVMAPVAVTDEDGRFVARGLRDVDHVVAARPDGAVDWTLVTDVVPGFDEPTITIGDTNRITVTAFSAAGEILARPAVVVQPINRLPLHPLIVPPISLAKRLSYTEDGRAVIEELDPGRYSILVKSEGFTVGKVEADITDGPAEVDVVLVEELFLDVRVVEAGTKQPVHWASVGVFDTKAADRAMRRVPLQNQRADANGQVRLSGLEEREYVVAVFHPAYAEAFAEVVVPGDPVTVELRQGGILAGRVTMGGAPPPEERFIATGKRERFPRFNVTDPDGSFEMTHLEPGEYTLTVMRRFADQSLGDQLGGFEQYIPERFERVTIEEGKTTFLEIDLLDSEDDGPKATLRGQVVLNGGPAAAVTIQARPEGNWRGQKSAVTDATGRFDFGQVPAKKTTVTVARKGRAGAFMFGRLAEQEVELTPGEVRDLRFDLDTGRVTGRVVVDRDGTPVMAAEVRLRSKDASDDRPFSGGRVSTATGRDGRFEFDEVASGTYSVSVRKDGFAGAVVPDLVVPARGAPPPVEIRLENGVLVKGKVVLPPGLAEPPRFIFLEFRDVEQNERRAGDRVDVETLEFVVEGIRPGRYQVRAFAGRDRFKPQEVDVPTNGTDGMTLTLELAPAEPQSGG